jgi:hypothetical protein
MKHRESTITGTVYFHVIRVYYMQTSQHSSDARRSNHCMQPNGNNLSHTTYCLCRFTHAGIAHLESRNTGCLPSSNYGGLPSQRAVARQSSLSRLPNGCTYVLLHMCIETGSARLPPLAEIPVVIRRAWFDGGAAGPTPDIEGGFFTMSVQCNDTCPWRGGRRNRCAFSGYKYRATVGMVVRVLYCRRLPVLCRSLRQHASAHHRDWPNWPGWPGQYRRRSPRP